MCDSVASIQLARSPTSSFADFPVYPALLTIISSAIVAAGGVTVEKLMKTHRDMSIFQQSIWLYLYVRSCVRLTNSFIWSLMMVITYSWGVIVNFIFLFIENGHTFIHKLTLKSFNFYAYMTVIW